MKKHEMIKSGKRSSWLVCGLSSSIVECMSPSSVYCCCKHRFVREKAAYKGPWAVPKRRAKKHPLAPKRPMSAFLKYSQTRRATVKADNPDMSNTDVSRLLGEMWRNASPKERAPYVEQEKRERAVYKDEIQKWRDDQARMDAASRTSHQSVHKLADYPSQPGFDRSYTASFENLHLDSFEEPPAQRSHRQAYSAPYAPYRQQYPSVPGKFKRSCILSRSTCLH
jgi:hypothetical protein